MTNPGSLTGLVVIVPTRNRADLAERTLLSLADEAPPVPVTVMVSDNSTDPDQADAVEGLVTDLQSRPGQHISFQLLRPPEDLAMGRHWEWARKQAGPEASHLLYLTDRTVAKPGALAALLEVGARHPGRVVSFNNDQVNDDAEPVTLACQSWSGEVHVVPSARLLDLAHELIIARPLPRALNSLMPVRVMDRIEAAFGDVFVSTAPDFCFCFRLLETVPDFVYLDRALTVMHGLARSNGNSTSTGVTSKDTADFIKIAAAEGIAPHAPLPHVTTTYNVIASEYAAHVRTAPPLNRRAYVQMLARETDGFAEGPMRAANETELGLAGMRFSETDRRRRGLWQVAHFLRVLGPVDFALLARDRLGQPAPRPFESKQAALAWSREHEVPPGSGRALRYLHGDRETEGARRGSRAGRGRAD